MSSSTSSRQERSQKAIEEAKAAGLLKAGSHAAFFRSLGLGEERDTAYFYSSKNNKPHIYGEWWVPAHLVHLNAYMEKAGLTSKLRAKTLRRLAEGKELPEKLMEVVASYTAEVLSRP